MEQLHANFKLAPRVGYTLGNAEINSSANNKYQGATFLGIVASKPPGSSDDFNGKEFAGMDIYLICPLSPGKATAPYTYKKSAKNMDAKSLQALNKNGSPLTSWADTNNSVMRFWSWAKVGFNRGARNEKLTWEYPGGDTFTFWVEPADLEESDEKPMGFYMDGKKPVNAIMDMDLVRVCIMPKSNEALSKPKKTCFAFKGELFPKFVKFFILCTETFEFGCRFGSLQQDTGLLPTTSHEYNAQVFD